MLIISMRVSVLSYCLENFNSSKDTDAVHPLTKVKTVTISLTGSRQMLNDSPPSLARPPIRVKYRSTETIKSNVMCWKCPPCIRYILLTDVEIQLREFILKNFQNFSSLLQPEEKDSSFLIKVRNFFQNTCFISQRAVNFMITAVRTQISAWMLFLSSCKNKVFFFFHLVHPRACIPTSRKKLTVKHTFITFNSHLFHKSQHNMFRPS